MLKKRGFTLIELLAVIVLLSVVAVIAVPIFLNVIEDSNKKTAEIMGEKIISYIEVYAGTYELENGYKYVEQKLYMDNNEFTNLSDPAMNGNLADFGEVYVDLNGNVTVASFYKNYCVIGNKNNLAVYEDIAEEDCVIDWSGPDFTITKAEQGDNTLDLTINATAKPGISLHEKAYFFINDWQASNEYNVSNSYNGIIKVRDAFGVITELPYNVSKLTLNANGGVITGATTYWLLKDEVKALPSTTKLGYTLSSWTITSGDGTVNGSNFTMGTNPATLTANWAVNSYTLTVNANGGTWSGTTPQTIAYGSTATIANPTRSSYVFTGWTVSGTGSSINGTTFTMGSANTTLTANWVMNSFTLTVNANGGTWSGTTPQTIVSGQTATIAAPTRAGYTFSSWTVSGTGSTINGTTFTMGAANTTLTANWTLNSYTLTVNANGGTWSGTSPQTIAYGSTSTISNPTKTFYVFAGWTVSCTGCSVVGTTFTMGTSNATLTASYTSMFNYTGTYTFIDDGSGNWRIKLLTSGTFTPAINMTIDVFLVGGGGGGRVDTMGGGGGSGYTSTRKVIALLASTSYPITVGAGGAAGSNGGSSSAFGYSIGGGVCGTLHGGAGGSGGGGAGWDNPGGNGGSNGSSGGGSYYWSGGYKQYTSGGTGQGTTTREFGDAAGTLYAGGGGGGGLTAYANTAGLGGAIGGGNAYYGAGTANTGGGGGSAQPGGSGIVIVRQAR